MNKQELLKLYDMDLNELVEMAEQVTKSNFTNEVEVCSIISAKTGKCGENCKYCSQSIHNHAEIKCHPLLDVEDVKSSAPRAKENGASRFCFVTPGRRAPGRGFEKLLEMESAVPSIDGIDCGAALGVFNE